VGKIGKTIPRTGAEDGTIKKDGETIQTRQLPGNTPDSDGREKRANLHQLHRSASDIKKKNEGVSWTNGKAVRVS